MALSVHPESQRNEKFKVGFYRYGFNSHQNQQLKSSCSVKSYLPSSSHEDQYSNPAHTSTPMANQQARSLLALKTRQMGTGLEYSEGPSLSSPQYDKTCDSGVFMPWSLDMSAEELGLPPATATLAMAPDTENQCLDSSLSSDRFGLNSSLSSGGFALDDLVAKILEDDQSLFAYNSLSDVSADSGHYGPTEAGFPGNGSVPSLWPGSSSLPQCSMPTMPTSMPTSAAPNPHLLSSLASSQPTSSPAQERPTRSTDLLWDLAPEPSLGPATQLLQESLLVDGMYSSPTLTSPPISAPTMAGQDTNKSRYHHKSMYGDDFSRPPPGTRDTNNFMNRMFSTNKPMDCSKEGNDINGLLAGLRPLSSHSNNTATSRSQQTTAATQETWSNAELQEAVGLERSLLAQLGAHLTPQQLERITSSARAGLGNFSLSDKVASSEGPSVSSPSRPPLPSQMSGPKPPVSSMANGAASNAGWSGPGTSTSSVPSGPPPTSSAAPALDAVATAQLQNARLQLLQQRAAAAAAKYSQQMSSVNEKRPFPGRMRHPFFPMAPQFMDPVELKHAAAALAALAASERYSTNGDMSDPSFPLRSHLIEEFLPPDYANIPPPPFGFKFPPGLPHHLAGSPPYSPDGRDFFPPHFDPYFHGRMPPFFGPNDMFFDVLPPHFFGLPQFFPGMKPPRRSGPSNELHLRLEECYDQFKNLERERKKTEAELARQNPGKKVSSANNIVIPRLPSNPSRVDRLVVDSLREHARVLTLISKMERLSGEAVHANIHSAMETWMEGIRKVQARRKEEIINATNRHRNGGPRYQEDKDVLALAASISELTAHLRRARTAMWCALQTSSKDGMHLRGTRPAGDTSMPLHTAADAFTQAVAMAAAGPANNSSQGDHGNRVKGQEEVGQVKGQVGAGGDNNNNVMLGLKKM